MNSTIQDADSKFKTLYGGDKSKYEKDLKALGRPNTRYTWLIVKKDNSFGELGIPGLIWERVVAFFLSCFNSNWRDRTVGVEDHVQKFLQFGSKKGWLTTKTPEIENLMRRVALNEEQQQTITTLFQTATGGVGAEAHSQVKSADADIATVGPLAEPLDEETLKTLKDLDSVNSELKPLAQAVTVPQFRIPLPKPKRSEAREKAKQAVNNFEQAFKKKYQAEFNDLSRHGMGSCMRILWQDPEFIKLIQDSENIQVLLSRTEIPLNTNADLHGPITLTSLFCFGLATNEISYLVTVSPYFKDANLVQRVSKASLLALQQGLANVKKVFKEWCQIEVPQQNQTMSEIMAKIRESRSNNLIHAISSFLNNDADVLKRVVEVKGNQDTTPNRLLEEIRDAMGKTYSDLTQSQKVASEFPTILTNAKISKALDARHLIVAIFQMYFSRSTATGEDLSMESLLGAGFMDGGEGEPTTLLLIRLRQAMRLLAEACLQQWPTRLDEISKKLSEVPPGRIADPSSAFP